MIQLPTVEGRNLLRQKKVFPADFEGALNLVFIAFLRRHQDLIDEWVPFVAQLAQEFPQLQYYEFPTLPNNGLFYRIFLNEGMRAGIPSAETRARTVTLYLDKRRFREALDIEGEKEMWLYLFDDRGRVLWRAAGQHTPEKGAALKAAVQQAAS